MALPTPKEYKDLLNGSNDHFNDVENKSIKPNIKDNSVKYSSNYGLNFENASKDYWNTKGSIYAPNYNSGDTLAKFNDKSLTIENFINSLSRCLKESIKSELHKNNITTEETKPYFDAIDNNMKLLINHLKKVSDTKISIKSLTAFLHGYINSYISNIVNNEIEREYERKNKT